MLLSLNVILHRSPGLALGAADLMTAESDFHVLTFILQLVT